MTAIRVPEVRVGSGGHASSEGDRFLKRGEGLRVHLLPEIGAAQTGARHFEVGIHGDGFERLRDGIIVSTRVQVRPREMDVEQHIERIEIERQAGLASLIPRTAPSA